MEGSFLTAAGAIFGAIIGSFLNVVIARLPEGRSLVTPGSRCGACGEPVAWHDNVPLLAWIWLRGRCRACRAPIPVRYPLVEAITALFFAYAAHRFGASIDLAAAWVLLAALVALTFIDLDHRIIPNEISLPGIPIGFLLGAMRPGVGPAEAALGVALGGGALFLIAWGYEKWRHMEGMGMGDVKLLAMIGGFLGWRGVVLTLLVASLTGSIVGVAAMVRSGKTLKLAIPFGPFLAFGAVVHLFWGEDLIAWYFGLQGP
jgi:leader peptidase (prepilin peptidase)/N-methyltransferase